MHSCMENATPSFIPRHPTSTSTEGHWKPRVDAAPSCPRCDSTNTKFCYYNNYSLSQPRYFCKGCRRYWTKGGSLRNVPVGGGCRKNRRGKLIRLSAVSSSSSSSSSTSSSDCDPLPITSVRPDALLDEPILTSTKPAPVSGTDIDLAALYARFLNQRPDCQQRAISPEFPIDQIFDLASGVPPQEPSENPSWWPPSDAPFSDFDPASYDIDAIIGNDSLWENCPSTANPILSWQPTSTTFAASPHPETTVEDPVMMHTQVISGSNWCSSLFEPAPSYDDLTAL